MATATLAEFRSAIRDLRNGVKSWDSLANSEETTEEMRELYSALKCEYIDAIGEVFRNRHGNSFPANADNEETMTEEQREETEKTDK